MYHGLKRQNFTQDQKVMIRRLNDGKEYRAKIVGVASDVLDGCTFYIVEAVDRIHGLLWSHHVMIESCLDPVEWEED